METLVPAPADAEVFHFPDAVEITGRGPQPHLSTAEAAKFATLAYVYGSGKGNEKDKADEVARELEGTGFELQPRFSNRQLSVFYRARDRHLHVAHKGTQPNSMLGTLDLISDMRLAVNLQGMDYQFRYRRGQTERAYKQYEPKIFTMSGHSLGGATVISTLRNSRFLWRAIDQADTFNAGANPWPKMSLGSIFARKRERRKRKKLGAVITHHRMTGDAVSESMKYSKPTGEVRTYDFPKQDNPISTALESHHLHHFEDPDEDFKTTGF